MREERDSLGSISLESECLYGIQTARALMNTSFSGSTLEKYPELIRALGLVKQACARANTRAGVLPAELTAAIEQACLMVLDGNYNKHFPVDMLHGGGYIAFNQNMNEVLANLTNQLSGNAPGTYVPVHPKTHINASQSTADVCHTAVRIAIFRRSRSLCKQLHRVAEEMSVLHSKFQNVQTVSRTCLRDALPVSMGETFGAFQAFFSRRAQSLDASLAVLGQINLGGTVIGSGDGATPDYRREVLKELASLVVDMPIHARDNFYDAAQNIDDLASVSAELRIIAEGSIKICKDLRLLGSGPNAGFGELILPGVQEGSSFFPGKFNPIVPETVIQACMQVLGADRVVSAALEHGELNLNIFEGAAAKNILDAIEMLNNALSLLIDKCLVGIEADEDRCRALISAHSSGSANVRKK